MEGRERDIKEYLTASGKSPFSEWLLKLRDQLARAIIRKRINRLRKGNFGDSKPVGDGVSELKIDFGPGYRVYFGHDGETIIVLLCGGDKGSQDADIKKAKDYWKDYWS
jgi:putative addiction module killer protein